MNDILLLFTIASVLLIDTSIVQAYTTIHDAAEAAELWANGNFTILLDVRQQKEWDDGHLPNATFIESLHANKDTTRINNCKNCAIAVYCTTGVRSKWAANTLETNGFTNVYDVLGIQQWNDAGTALVNTLEVDPDCEEVTEPENCDCDKCISTKVMAVSAAGNTFDGRSKKVTIMFNLVGIIILYINS